MIVLIHRGYLGFQPNAVTSSVSYSFTEPKLENFIAEGILYLPISDLDLDSDDLGNSGKVLSPYKFSRTIYYRWFQWDKYGPFDNTCVKNSDDPENGYSRYSRIPLSRAYNTSSVMAKDPEDANYLAALIHADATLEQIDSFTQEFLIGSAKKFIWTEWDDVRDLIIESKEYRPHFPHREKREGPSRHLPIDISEIAELVESLDEKNLSVS